MPAVSSELASPPKKSIAENVRETLESIVVAFVLAFVFRAFIVEAFVIPTGSMAPTLYGDHLTNTCSECGFEFAVGMPRMGNPDITLRCPNCDLLSNKFTREQAASPDSGDRILVHKWPFDIGGPLLGPKRWDVTVFKDTRDGTTNFIKRLVGLPGEVLEIIDGDVYAVPIDRLKPELVEELDDLRKVVYRLRVSGLDRSEPDILQRYSNVNRRLLPELKIQRKKPQDKLQESLWFTVYNHDFLPNYEKLHSPRPANRVGWAPVSAMAGRAWRTADRELSFQADKAVDATGNGPLYVEFSGKPINDFYAYNNDGVLERDMRSRQPVGDVRLRFVWFPDAGQGSLHVKMNRDRDEFTATINVDGNVRVDGYHPDSDLPGHRQVIGEKQLDAFRLGSAVEIEFINLDYRVALLVNGQEVIASTDEKYAPRLTKLSQLIDAAIRDEDGDVRLEPTRVRIGAKGINCRLRHVVLERDVYYRSQRQGEDRQQDQPSVRNPYFSWPGWGTAGFPILLRTGREVDGQEYFAEYFMLGDNSPASKDSRMWWEIGPHLRYLGEEYQVGTVPEDQLIGKAFFVYWPAGYRLSWFGGIGVIPNIGRMRWIR